MFEKIKISDVCVINEIMFEKNVLQKIIFESKCAKLDLTHFLKFFVCNFKFIRATI